MVLILILIFVIFVALWIFLKDKRYSQADLKDVMSDEMKKELKLKGTDDRFEKQIYDPHLNEKKSVNLLKELNKK